MLLLRTSLVAQAGKNLPPEFDPWVRKIPWRRKWQPTPVFLPGESHGQSTLVGYSHEVTKSQTRLSNSTTAATILPANGQGKY